MTPREQQLRELLGRTEALLERVPADVRERIPHDVLRSLMGASNELDLLATQADADARELIDATRARLHDARVPTRWKP